VNQALPRPGPLAGALQRLTTTMSPKTLRTLLVFVALAAAVAWPWALPIPLPIVGDATKAAEYGLIAVSLVLLTGWVGQISLAQGSFVGVGAFMTALIFRRFDIGFPYSLPLAVASSAGLAVLLGLVALRVRGLYLAVATLIFAWMADQFLFSANWFVGIGGTASFHIGTIGREGTVPSFDLHDPRIFYVVALAGLVLGIYCAANLRDSKTGRAFFAVRGSEIAAASLGMDVTRYKLLAFGLSGAIAGMAGHLQIVGNGSAVPGDFNFLRSLFFLTVAVVGGLNSLPGVVVAGALFAGLDEVFFRVPALNGFIDLVSGVLLLGVLLIYPGGLAAIGAGAWARARAVAHGVQRVLARESPDVDVAPKLVQAVASDIDKVPVQTSLLDLTNAATVGARVKDRDELAAVLTAEHITVRFGGLVAVDDVSLTVRQGEIVGLIGPNGAGKTTLFNAISGLNDPTSGRVDIFGHDATKLLVHERARLGVGRTFQLIQLFPQLNVFDNLLAATHLANPTGFLQHIVVTETSLAAERECRERVSGIIERLRLTDVAHRTVSGLPFGVLRTVELARALVTGAPFVMLDEPASGLDNAETEQLAQLLLTIRADLGVTLLLIEHDVAMVTGVTDYMYVVNRGKLLAQGSPAEIQRNEAVIAAYLGQPTVVEVTA
jgi:ABC-type branched-subunit amino acid transport system ATPase component/ABC-type branched-subunit amino acid transport system permease subunit